MQFRAAIRSCLRQYATSAGRAGRMEYWSFFLFSLALGLLLPLVDRFAHFPTNLLDMGPVAIVAQLLLVLPGVAVQIRRLHDLDKSWKWGLLFLIPVAGWLALMVLNVLPGTPGDNRYGPPPDDRTPDIIPAAA